MRRKAWIFPVIAGAGLGALAYAAYRPVRDAARARISTGSRIASTRCGPIEFAESGEGPAVLSVPNGEAVLRVLYDLAARPVLFGRFARKYAEISRRNLTAQGGLFPQEIVTPADAIRQAATAS